MIHKAMTNAASRVHLDESMWYLYADYLFSMAMDVGTFGP
jgi:hypothetical protein